MHGTESPGNNPPTTATRVCCICGKQATRIVFSSVGHWKVCDQPTCWNTLTERYEDTGLTWMSKPISQPPKNP